MVYQLSLSFLVEKITPLPRDTSEFSILTGLTPQIIAAILLNYRYL